MRNAVFVADDAGMDVARNRGILTACEVGVVRAVSVLANAPAVEDFARRFRAAGLPVDVGLHLDLTEGRALSGPIAGLTDTRGRFLGDKRALWLQAEARPIDAVAVEIEAEAQLARLSSLGLDPSFANGHQHVHLLPGVREGLTEALDRRPWVRWVRCPERPVLGDAPGPSSNWPTLSEGWLDERGRGWARAGWCAEAAFAAWGGLETPLRTRGRHGAHGLVGLDLLEGMDAAALLDRLARAAAVVPDGGVVEVMVHPGECDPDSVGFSGHEAREEEAGALCCEQLLEGLAPLGYRVARFTDWPSPGDAG